jgi:hypothetical protein
MLSLSLFLTALAVSSTTTALPTVEVLPTLAKKHGFTPFPSFSGNFTINQYQLYAENADYDFNSGLLYLGFVPKMS